MKEITIEKQKIDYKAFVKKTAKESDCKNLLKDEFLLRDKASGQIIALYSKPDHYGQFFEKIRKTCSSTKFQILDRLSGLKSGSAYNRIFGYRPRNGRRRNFCSVASLAYEQRSQHKIFAEGGSVAAEIYAQHNPDLFRQHNATAETKVLPEFRIKNSPFTSGIVNDNNPLCYHFDVGNFHNVWSAMIVLKQGVKNGHLSMPEYDIKCEVADKSIFFFDGQSILHGVTPIVKTNAWGRRFSIVYYSLRDMWKCLPVTDEVARIRNLRTEMETKGYVPAIKQKK